MPLTDLQKTIFYTNYSRWNSDKKRRETWEETVDRVIEFLNQTLIDYSRDHNVRYPNIDILELREAMLKMEVLPSMRVLQMAGPALDRCNVGAYNPVSGDTEVVTKEYGTVPIVQLAGRVATVLNVEGRWAEASFTGYGEQQTRLCKFRPATGNAQTTDVRATDNHRWVLTTGVVKSTAELEIGDKVKFVSASRQINTNSIDYKLGLKHGLIYGDGTATYKQERDAGYHIRLCSDKDELLPIFEGNKVTYPPSFNGDPVVMLYDGFAKTHQLKELPAPTETDDYLVGFIRGWFAADGHVSPYGQFVLCGDAVEAEWFKLVSRLGYIVQSSRPLPKETNFGTRKKKSLSINFFRASLTYDDFIIARKRINFKPIPTTYTFAGFGPTTHTNVYCAEVPDTNTFVLGRGLVTGNCAYLPLSDWRALGELLYILMQGTGVGFSVEQQYVDQLPTILPQSPLWNGGVGTPVFIIPDSTEGWCDALVAGLNVWAQGGDVEFDYSRIRPYGAPLKTKGGRSSGPEPLKQLLTFARKLILQHQGRKLSSLNVHDLACYCGAIVQVGGIRRAAEISLSDLNDHRMRGAKTGQFWLKTPERAMANNSAVYTSKPDIQTFTKEWLSLMESGTGERGIFNRDSLTNCLPVRRHPDHQFGVNPCGEIILRPYEFCNLSIAVIRPEDSLYDIQYKVQMATKFGIIQSLLTNFNYIREDWAKNAIEERLLGVDITGQMDNELFGQSTRIATYRSLNVIATTTAFSLAGQLAIKMPAAITTVKPSGNSSQLLGCSSGIHPRFAPYYVRRVRVNATNPVAKLLIDRGVPHFPEVGQPPDNPTVWVFEFPVVAPEWSVFRENTTALMQLEQWKDCKINYTEHNPSCTIYVKEDEWLEVGAWVYKNWNIVGGLSFLPYDGGVYDLAPYEEITAEEYEKRQKSWPLINFDDLANYETFDTTEVNREYSCTGDKCEL